MSLVGFSSKEENIDENSQGEWLIVKGNYEYRRCNTPSPLRLGLSHFFFYNKIFAKIHKVYQST
jgi:hypothetical protein